MRISVALAVACLTLASLSATAQTSAAIKRYDLNIPRQTLDTALKDLAQQTGLQVARFSDAVKGDSMVGPLTGEYTAELALASLLESSGLTYRSLNERAVIILRPEDVSKLPVSSSAESGGAGLRLAGEDSSANTNSSVAGSKQSAGQVQGMQQVEGSQPQSSESQENKIQEIIVTAQKREEKLQDVPISISVLDGDQLDTSTDTSILESLSRVPGVSLTYGFVPKLVVRGVSALGSVLGGGSPVAFYVDSVPFGFTKQAVIPDPDTYDLDRVEVLRGPQGTLYGANALNGVVRILTKNANPDAFEFKARTSISGTDQGGENYRGDLAVNVPIIEGKLAARAVVGYQDLSGWIDRPDKKDANDGERASMRLKVNAQPTEQLAIGLTAWSVRTDYDAYPVGFDSGHSAVPGDEPITDDYDTYGLKISYDFPGFSLTSMTSYLEYRHEHSTNLGPFAPVLEGFFFDMDLDADTFAQEFNLVSTLEGPWRWSAGGMYRDSSDTVFQHLVDLSGPIAEENVSKSYAVFGELTRLFLDGQWEFTAGLRYFEDDVAFTELLRSDGTAPEQLLKSDREFSATTKRFALAWHPTEQLTTYASYGEGFRSGAEQNSETLAVAPEFPPIEPDALTNYEVGAKGSLWGGRVSFDTALYYINWQDVQLPLVVPADTGTGGAIDVSAIVNGSSASGVGVDFALATELTDRLKLGINVGWNDLTVDEDVFTGGALLFEKGDRVGTTPEYTAGAFADYVFPLTRGGLEGLFSISADYASERTAYVATVPRIAEASDSILTGRARLSIRAPTHWAAVLFVDNLNNEEGVVEPSTLPDLRSRLRPRTIGVQLEYTF